MSEFDQHAVVPVHGFDSVDHYYTESSAIHRSHNITTLTLAISAEDDPVCSVDGCPTLDNSNKNSSMHDGHAEIGEGLVVVRTVVGGHLGFGCGFLPGVVSWMDQAAVDCLDSCLEN